MPTYQIKGGGKIELDNRKLTQIRFSTRDMEDAAARRAAMETVEYIREHWSGYAPPASSPGQPPAVDEGNLDEAMEITRRATSGRGTEWIAFVNKSKLPGGVPYDEYLEYGTAKMSPRPFMRPAAEHTRRTYEQLAKDEVEKILNSKLR